MAAEYGLAEAQYLLGEALGRYGSAAEKDGAKTARTQAAKGMQAAAEKVLRSLDAIRRFGGRGRSGPGEIASQYQIWSRKVMAAKLILAESAKQKIAAIRDYLSFCRKALSRILDRRSLDPELHDVAAAKYHVAEAEYLLADVDPGTGSSPAAGERE